LLALQLGATFVAPIFCGDKAQLVPLIEAAIAHQDQMGGWAYGGPRAGLSGI
jgi:pyruvate/2-oxoacid:ferredoxin oxidoreductase beta subunit